MNINRTLTLSLNEHISILQNTIDISSEVICIIIDLVVDCFLHGGKLLFCGNGGSAAASQHIAAEFINRYRLNRPGLPAIALTPDSSLITSIGNDYSFEEIFSRQVETLAVKGDILVAFSTSGNSPNILRALKFARQKSMILMGFTGQAVSESMRSLCDYCLIVQSSDTARIQECHEFIWHVICKVVEERIFIGR